MLTSLANEFDKSLGLAALRDGEIEVGINHIENYLKTLDEYIGQNTDNSKYIEEKNNLIKNFKENLSKIAPSLYAAKKWRLCATCCKYLIKYGTSDNAVYKHASFCFRELNQKDHALELIKIYAKREPADPMLDIYLGEAYYQADNNKNAEIALTHLKKALEKYPKDYQLYNIIGNIYAKTIDVNSTNFDNQHYYFSEGLKYAPNDKNLLRNIHLTYLKQGDIKSATRIYNRIYKLYGKDFNHDAYFDYAAFLIYIGNFKTGWRHLEHRFEKETDPTYYPKINKKLWNGISNIQKDTLLVHAEQGFGDVIMYIRFVEQIQKYAKKVIVKVQDNLYELFKESKLPFEIYPISKPMEALDFDYHLPLISIPRIIKLTPETISPKGGYLNISPKRIQVFTRDFLKTNKFKIGVCFEGNQSAKAEQRDIDWKYLSLFAQNKNIQFYCLKKGLDEDYFKNIDQNINIKCFDKILKTFADTATAMKGMDLIISTDNVILNLAGALGIPTLGLYNTCREYRWYGTEEGRCIWYNSVKPMQTKKHNDWDELMNRVVEEVNEIVENRYQNNR